MTDMDMFGDMSIEQAHYVICRLRTVPGLHTYQRKAIDVLLAATDPAMRLLPDGCHVTPGFEFDRATQEHIPTIIIRLPRVKAGPDAKPWIERDKLAARLTTPPKLGDAE